MQVKFMSARMITLGGFYSVLKLNSKLHNRGKCNNGQSVSVQFLAYTLEYTPISYNTTMLNLLVNKMDAIADIIWKGEKM